MVCFPPPPMPQPLIFTIVPAVQVYSHGAVTLAFGPKPKECKFPKRLTTARHALRDVIQKCLVAATGNRHATMMYTLHETTGAQKIIFRYGVELVGWPKDVTFESPGHISSIHKLNRLRAGFERGRIRFRRLSAAEISRRERRLGLAGDESRRGRRDAAQVRQLRPVETRSKLLRNGTGIKTREWIVEDDEAEEGVEEAV